MKGNTRGCIVLAARRTLFVALPAFLSLVLASVSCVAHDGTRLRHLANWTDGYALILTNNSSIGQMNEARDFADREGARIAVLFPPNAMFGWVPAGIESRLIGRLGIDAVIRNAAEPAATRLTDKKSRFLVSCLNSISAQSRSGRDPARRPAVARPLNDALTRPPLDLQAVGRNLGRLGVKAPEHHAAYIPGMSDTMTGTVAVALFFIESDGTIDADTYTWTEQDEQEATNRALAGLSFWSLQAASRGINLSFTLFNYPSTGLVSRQGYEPTAHSQNEDQLWIEKIMENLGLSSGGRFERVTAFNAALKEKAGADWAYSVFVAYNPPPAPSRFTDGYSAYAYFGGPYVQMLFINDGWGRENFDVCLSHETGHIFWACDEYYQPGYGGCTSCGACNPSGPRSSAPNGNCENCNPDTVPCMMRYNSPTICSYTEAQIGWPSGPLSVSPADDTLFVGKPGGPFSPASVSYVLKNSGITTEDWTASKTQPWLTVSPDRGTLAPGAEVTVTLTINDAARGLSYGEYTAAIVFADSAAGNKIIRVVQLTISDPEDSTDNGDRPHLMTESSGGGCFIATVAFGSDLSPQVIVFKEFRDRYLLTFPLGRRLVAFYYKHSPRAASLVSQSPIARACCRLVLGPVAYLLTHRVGTEVAMSLSAVAAAFLAGATLLLRRFSG